MKRIVKFETNKDLRLLMQILFQSGGDSKVFDFLDTDNVHMMLVDIDIVTENELVEQRFVVEEPPVPSIW